jgi:mono/diheme cytochrome c family protein
VKPLHTLLKATASLVPVVALSAYVGAAALGSTPEASRDGAAPPGDVLRGRPLTLHHGCGDCHGGFANPAADGFLAGMMIPEQEFVIGPFKTRPRNLTPDNATGLGRFSERQIFNALRYGLRPGETPDVEITSTVPGQGNFPARPKYLAPPMPWPAFRHMPDQELWDIAAYLKRGVKPVQNRVADSEGPPDFWASEYTAEKIGTYPPQPFPTEKEVAQQ